MEINNAVSLYFSPTGSTRRIVTEISRSLPWPSRELDVTDYSANDEVCRRTARELLLAGVPVYGGRVPATAVRRLKNIRGSDTPAVIVAVFGNRDYDDALLELKDLLEGQGFRVAAALAAVSDVMARMGADSRAARLCCVISGASETVFFTASLYLGAAGVKRSRYAVPAALVAYAAGVWAAAWLV